MGGESKSKALPVDWLPQGVEEGTRRLHRPFPHVSRKSKVGNRTVAEVKDHAYEAWMAIPASIRRKAMIGLAASLLGFAFGVSVPGARSFGAAIFVASSFTWIDVGMWIEAQAGFSFDKKVRPHLEKAEHIYFSDLASVRLKLGGAIALAAGLLVLVPSEYVVIPALIIYGVATVSLCMRDAFRAVRRSRDEIA
jgi:hypothetical protein